MRQEYCNHSSLDSGRDGRVYQGQTELEDRDVIRAGIAGLHYTCMYQGFSSTAYPPIAPGDLRPDARARG
ncbi:hypothetical protein NEUTE1DRAFT_98219 [Neurospora tetrasperma FGSC 2508]|uniref:Uncharacterized protein n=1 Tax=Neurospora tetrasperma (strain FGSC 2508 / ATCC MYA-4615 / P0657) TaxID=510951 RepID=F8MBA4_NEUT8|nr:uncharacterized protein NEUTE1DRAFT_98219 [Neurospora tetrasperma FGSC 2508]EGO61069.1 hypothetical protein NEUTE1DRAFT_98219 [Neurospora tetrasperma FGSC 2508]